MQTVFISNSVGTLSSSSACRRLVVVGATHPNHKAVKLMNHRRPKKKTPADKRHRGATYPDLPPPPPEYTVVSK